MPNSSPTQTVICSHEFFLIHTLTTPMIPIRSLIAYFILFAGFQLASAALENVTIDDAVLTGAVVPQYLPSASSWKQGNDCSTCLAKPDPSQAYNGTWHDATFQPGTTISQTIEFTFRGRLPARWLQVFLHATRHNRKCSLHILHSRKHRP